MLQKGTAPALVDHVVQHQQCLPALLLAVLNGLLDLILLQSVDGDKVLLPNLLDLLHHLLVQGVLRRHPNHLVVDVAAVLFQELVDQPLGLARAAAAHQLDAHGGRGQKGLSAALLGLKALPLLVVLVLVSVFVLDPFPPAVILLFTGSGFKMAVSDPRPSPAALPAEVALVESDLFRPPATKLDILQRTLLRHGDRLASRFSLAALPVARRADCWNRVQATYAATAAAAATWGRGVRRSVNASHVRVVQPSPGGFALSGVQLLPEIISVLVCRWRPIGECRCHTPTTPHAPTSPNATTTSVPHTYPALPFAPIKGKTGMP